MEISCRNVREYLIERRFVHPDELLGVKELGGGVSNVVLMLCTARGNFVLKQALPRLRVKDEWLADLDRIWVERDCMMTLRSLFSEPVVPEVVWEDSDNYVIVMTAAPEDAVSWKEQLMKGIVYVHVARKVASLLAVMHEITFQNPELARTFGQKRPFSQLRLDPYYATIARRHPDVRRQVDALIDESLKRSETLVHGDYSPKNMLVNESSITLLDFEVAHYGDPTFDTAFCLNHLFLKAFKNPQWSLEYFRAAREFWDAYSGAVSFARPEDLEERTVRHLGALMLARIDGKSPVEYITDDATKERVRRASKLIIFGSCEGAAIASAIRSLQDVMAIVRKHLE